MVSHVQVESGAVRVADRVIDAFKIYMKREYKKGRYKWKIARDTEDRWEPRKPVYISAQTGQGKNYFIENRLLPYVRELNNKNGTNHKVLIISNRIALKLQIESRIKNEMYYEDDEQGKMYRYKGLDYVDVINYQGLLNRVEYLQGKQKSELESYIFVICDEAHFFTSDCMFNYDTGKILSMIVTTFKGAIRVYMTATPYECLEYINEYENKNDRTFNSYRIEDCIVSTYEWHNKILYHFERDYSYLDTKYYSSLDELVDIIVKSVTKERENWLIFLDDIDGGKDFKSKLESDPGFSTKNKDESKVLAVNAKSKEDKNYQKIICEEKFIGIKVLISTSVLDNGVNFRGVNNVVVSDISQVKVLQMVGRARVEKGQRVTLYLKRFDAQEFEKRIASFKEQQDAYKNYELAVKSKAGLVKFLGKYFHGNDHDWENAKKWFGVGDDSLVSRVSFYPNEIARSYVDKLVPVYESISKEMRETDEGQEVKGQKYLEYQLSWFGKEYNRDDDITLVGADKAKEDIISFLEEKATKGTPILEEDQKKFSEEFTKLHDKAFGRQDKNLARDYGINKINKILDSHGINCRLESCPAPKPEGGKGYWKVVHCNRGGREPTITEIP